VLFRSPVKPLHCLSNLEEGWLQTPDPERKLAHFEKLLGAEALAQIAISDRELSAGWIHGGTQPLTPLRHRTANNKCWQAYLAGLISFFHELFKAGDFDFVLSYPVQDSPSVAAGLLAAHFNVPFLSPKPIGFQTHTCLFDDVRNHIITNGPTMSRDLTIADPRSGSGDGWWDWHPAKTITNHIRHHHTVLETFMLAPHI